MSPVFAQRPAIPGAMRMYDVIYEDYRGVRRDDVRIKASSDDMAMDGFARWCEQAQPREATLWRGLDMIDSSNW